MEFLDFFNYSFFNRALIMSILGGISCGIIGVWILLLNIPFIGVAMSHAAFAGAMTGLLLGINPVLCGFIFCIGSSIFIDPVAEKTKLHNNISISLLFSFMLGIAFLFIGMLKDYRAEVLGFMWGNILTTTWRDVILISIATVLLISFIIIFHRGILAILFNREISRACGIPEKLIFYVLLILSSIIVSLNLHSIGGLLIYSLIALPSASAYQLTYRTSTMYIISSAFAITACILGLFISTITALPVGATIILLSCSLFLISVIFSKKRNYEKKTFF
ncbi:MAG: metal ABC transporter permease [Endomicrobiaceae bacterium]|nr:metal ABC transporter permease [Endomicrobiaceae bacterium]MDD3052894.1 metal ABC transporter permease [Endomicrobiaceae bacterium]MDD3922116.1 metal ABC transporter permease [Endomicrobiaceae bacterium]